MKQKFAERLGKVRWFICFMVLLFLFSLGLTLFVAAVYLARCCIPSAVVRRKYVLSGMNKLLALLFFTVRLLRIAKISLHGEAHLQQDNASLVIANHPTLFDALLLLALRPDLRCVAKPSLSSHPLYRVLIEECGHVATDEPDVLLDQSVALLKSGYSLLLFPEGTRSHQGAVRPFSRSAAIIALRSEVQILPVVIQCSPLILFNGFSFHHLPASQIDLTVSVWYPFFPTAMTTERAEGGAGRIPSNAAHSVSNERTRSRALTRELEQIFVEHTDLEIKGNG